MWVNVCDAGVHVLSHYSLVNTLISLKKKKKKRKPKHTVCTCNCQQYTRWADVWLWQVCQLMTTIIICTTGGLDYWEETHLPHCDDGEGARCVCECVCVCVHVCVVMHVWAIGTHSSLPRSEKAAVFISRSHWLCIQREFRLCDYNKDITMDKNATDVTIFPKLIDKNAGGNRKVFFCLFCF